MGERLSFYVVQVRLLGSVSVVNADGAIVLGGPKERAVLAVLALDAGRVVSKARLMDAIWEDDTPRTASKTIDTYVLRLRKVLARAAPSGHGGVRIETQSPGYMLVAGPDGVDVACVERLVRRARDAAQRGDHASAVALFREAAGFWRGRALEEFAGQRFADGAVARLEELHLTVQEERIEAELALGRHVELVAELESLVAAHPLRERPWGQLMTALYRSNRQADALRAYQRARVMLIEELGVEPGAYLRQLEAAVIAQDRSLEGPRPGGSALGGTSSPSDGDEVQAASAESLHNLPVQVSSFIGRQRDSSAILAALDAARVLTLTGPGGVGKTRLALEVANAARSRFSDGVWHCALAPLVHGDDAGRALATVLSVQERPDLGIVESLVRSVRGRHLLLVLDNAEHLLDVVGGMVEAIVRGAPGVQILVTSRAPLGVDGEQVWPVQPLPLPAPAELVDVSQLVQSPAVTLFVDRARVADARFALTEANAAAVKEVCIRLDGIPLALELAAARTRFMSPSDLAARLDRPLRLLTASARTNNGRHRTLRTTVDWSYDLLDAHERRVFNRLAVFAGGFDLDAAEQVCRGPGGDEPGVVEILGGLVDQSMVIADPLGTSTRFHLLEALREYGQERLEELEESADLQRRHAEYFVNFAEYAEPQVRGPEEAYWVHRLDQDFYNLRAAHTWAVRSGDADTALRLVAPLYDFGMWRMRYEVAAWADSAVRLPAAANHPLMPAVLAIAGHGAWARGEVDGARALGERALVAEATSGGPRSWLPRILLAHLAVTDDRLAEATHHLDHGMALASGLDAGYEMAHMLWLAASILGRSGDRTGAIRVAEEALALARQTQNPTAIAMSLHELGREVKWKDPRWAMALFEESIQLASSVSGRLAAGMASRELTALRAAHDDAYLALRAYPDLIEHWSRAGDWWNQWINLRKLAVLLLDIGRAEAAATLHAAASSAHPSRPTTAAHAERLALLESELGHERFRSAVVRGSVLTPDEVVAFARREVQDALVSMTKTEHSRT